MTTVTSLFVELSLYRDRYFKGSQGELERFLRTSSTLYVGNLSFYTTEEQMFYFQNVEILNTQLWDWIKSKEHNMNFVLLSTVADQMQKVR
jgi:hypothetical protein